jgi:hypothetical protein
MHIGKAATRITIIIAGIIAMAGAVPIVEATASPATRTTSTIINTNDFAGYAVPSGFTSAQATFKIPRTSCGSTQTGLDPDIDLVGPEGLDSQVGISQFCGTNSWFVYFIINGKQTNSITVAAGNTVTATASETLSLTNLKLKDDTTGASNAVSGPGGTVTSILIGDEANYLSPYAYLPPSRFTTDSFTKVTAGGMSLGLTDPVEAEWVHGKTVWLATSAIQGGNAFTVTFKEN